MKLTIFNILLSFALALSGCHKLIEVDAPIDKIVKDNIFTSVEGAKAAVNGIYSRQVPRISDNNTYFMFTGGMTIWAGLSADELHNARVTTLFQGVEDNQIDPTFSSLNSAFWTLAYADLYHINSCIEGLAASNALPENVRNQLSGECYFLRAFYYFYLTQVFGDVPLLTTTDYTNNSLKGRNPVAEVVSLVMEDLDRAYLLTPAEPDHGMRSRVTKATVAAFAARVYLFAGQWEKAVQFSDEVLQDPAFQLESDHNMVFKRSSRELIWYWANTRDFAVVTGEAYGFVVPGYVSSFMTEDLIASFDSTTDLRWKKWVLKKQVNGADYHVPYKYKQDQLTDLNMKDEDYTIMRLAEQYFINAEAHLMLGNEEAALARIDTIRKRSGLELLSEQPQRIAGRKQIMAQLEEEKRREFFCEWGHRWLDLKRWPGLDDSSVSRAEEVLKKIKPLFTRDALLYPIPESELLLNPNLTQNKGY